MSSNQVLYLSYDGMTDPLGQSQVLPYIIGLSTKGYEFTLVSCEKKDLFLKNKTIIKNICKAHNIDWQPIFYTKKPPIISTIWDIFKLNRKVKKLHQQKNFSLIHCRSYIPALIGLGFKKKKNVNFLFDMRGFWADERVDGNLWDLNKFYFKWIYNYFKEKEKEFLSKSAYTISLTYKGKKEIETWNIKNLSPIQVIPCCTDEELFNTSNIKNIREKLGVSENNFVLSYFGSIGTWYMLDEMLDFFKALRLRKKNAIFLFVTKDNPQKITNAASKKRIDINNIIITSSPRKMMPSYIYLSDYSIFFIKPYFSKKASSPTKMGEIMSMGVPIICNSGVGDVDVIMNKLMPEYLVHKFSVKEYNKVCDLILKSNVDIDKVKSVAKKYFSLKDGVDNYFKVYQTITHLN